MGFPDFLKRSLCILLALVFCFTFTVRPTQVKAEVLSTATVVGVSALVVVGSALIALGVAPAADGYEAFAALAQTVLDGLDDGYKLVADGITYLSMLQYGSYFWANKSLIADILDCICGSGVWTNYQASLTMDTVVGSTTLGNLISTAFGKHSGTIYFSCVTDSNYVYVRTFQDMPYLRSDGLYSSYYTSYVDIFYLSSGSHKSTESYSSGVGLGLADLRGYKTDYFSDLGLVYGNLAEDLEDEKYRTWVQEPLIEVQWGVQLEPDPENPEDPTSPTPSYIPYLPIKLPNNPTEFPNYTQEEIQQGGESVLDSEKILETGVEVELDPDSVPDDLKTSTDTSTDSGSSGSSSPTSGTISNSGTTDPGKFQVDLTQFFPFCIPFDLYKMLSCLSADPQAPVFELACPLPGGRLYEFEIDLSVWDDVAATVRAFELAAFCVGLLFLTRKVIKW